MMTSASRQRTLYLLYLTVSYTYPSVKSSRPYSFDRTPFFLLLKQHEICAVVSISAGSGTAPFQGQLTLNLSSLSPSSLSGSPEALRSLLRTDAPQAFLYAISNFGPTHSVTLKAAFARALRALAVAISETVGPSQWGLRSDTLDIRYDAKVALDSLFQVGVPHHSFLPVILIQQAA